MSQFHTEASADEARLYRRMADVTRRLAWEAPDADAKDALLDVAMGWVFLADELRHRPCAANQS